jgi:hypothetical protein
MRCKPVKCKLELQRALHLKHVSESKQRPATASSPRLCSCLF